MSSHHIVRDCQEPALWITAENTCSLALIQELLGWSPWFLVEGEVAQQITEWGLKMDALLLPTQELKNFSALILDQNPLHVIDYQRDMIGLGLRHLIDKGISTVHMCTDSKRSKHIQAKFPDIDWVFFYQNYKMIFQKQHHWKKWLAANQELIIEGEGIEVINLFNHPAKKCHYSAIQEGFVEISTTQRGFWISEKLD